MLTFCFVLNENNVLDPSSNEGNKNYWNKAGFFEAK